MFSYCLERLCIPSEPSMHETAYNICSSNGKIKLFLGESLLETLIGIILMSTSSTSSTTFGFGVGFTTSGVAGAALAGRIIQKDPELSRECSRACRSEIDERKCKIYCLAFVILIFQILGIVLMAVASNNPDATITNPTLFDVGAGFLGTGTIVECGMLYVGCRNCCRPPPLADQGS